MINKSNHITSLFGEHQLLDLEELALLLGRRPETIRKDLLRRPDAVPPRLRLPGTRLLRWRLVDVSAWMAMHVERGEK